jgi:membrane-associated phospholipid phosphatase
MRRILAASTLLVVLAAPAWAQDALKDPAKDPTPPETAPPSQPNSPNDPESPTNPRRPIWRLASDVASDFKHLPTRDSALIVGIGSALALAVHPIDPDTNARLVGRGWSKEVFAPGKVLGNGAFQAGVAVVTYATGKAINGPKTVHIGVDLMRAQVVASALTFGLKVAVRRQRPDGNGYSFPSGHAALTFASASVLQRHFGWKGAIAYSAASYVAASRLRDNRHYLSDVTFGAALGTIAGRTVTRHGRDKFSFAAVPTRGGAMILAYRN